MAEPDPALGITDDDERCKAEALAALHRLGNAVDVNQLLDQFLTAGLTAATVVVTAATATIVAATAVAALGHRGRHDRRLHVRPRWDQHLLHRPSLKTPARLRGHPRPAP